MMFGQFSFFFFSPIPSRHIYILILIHSLPFRKMKKMNENRIYFEHHPTFFQLCECMYVLMFCIPMLCSSFSFFLLLLLFLLLFLPNALFHRRTTLNLSNLMNYVTKPINRSNESCMIQIFLHSSKAIVRKSYKYRSSSNLFNIILL